MIQVSWELTNVLVQMKVQEEMIIDQVSGLEKYWY